MEEKYTNIKERCLYFAKNQGIGVENFLNSIDMSYGSFKGKAKKGSLNSDALVKIYTKYPNINTEWLLIGEGEMLKRTEESDLMEPLINYSTKQQKGTPLIPTEAFAGLSSGDVSIMGQDIMERYMVPDFTNVDFMIRVKGASMYPKYNSGDVVACKMINSESFLQWNKVHVIATKEQGVLIKRIDLSEKEDCIKAISDNEKYRPFDIPKEEILNIALVTGVIRLE